MGLSLIPLREIAHGRAGDKGNTSNISVIACDPQWYETILRQVTEDAVRRLFAARRPSSVRRFELPRLHAVNFVLEDALEGGVNGSLNLDAHGKSLAFHLLALPVHIPDHLVALLVPRLATPGTREYIDIPRQGEDRDPRH